MKETIKVLAEIVNVFHDLIMKLSNAFDLGLTDKDLHFWVIGILGMITFFITNIAFKAISKWSISFISFIYSFTVLLVLVFAIEIQQKITGRGNMEFADVVVGLYGFLLLFIIYNILLFIIKSIINKLLKKEGNKENKNNSTKLTRWK